MSETRPYAMIIMAVFGLLSAFIYARESGPPTSSSIQAVGSAGPTMVMPAAGNFPVQAQAPQPLATVMPRGYIAPAAPTAVPGGVSTAQPLFQRSGQPIVPPAPRKPE